MEQTILVVDDSADDILILQRVISRLGLDVSFKFLRGGGEAIEYLSGARGFEDRSAFPFPQLMLLDLKMPGANGFDVLEWLHQRSPLNRLRVVVFTSSADPRDVDRAYDLGASSYLMKPVAMDEMEPILRCLMQWMEVNRFPRCFANGSR